MSPVYDKDLSLLTLKEIVSSIWRVLSTFVTQRRS